MDNFSLICVPVIQECVPTRNVYLPGVYTTTMQEYVLSKNVHYNHTGMCTN